MNIALIGYGKMGHEIDALARQQGETICRTFDIDSLVTAEALAGADVCIEFSTPEAVMDNIRTAVRAGKDIVIGTTGWYDRLPEVRSLVKDSGLLYSSNFSIGVNIYFRIVSRAAELINKASEYDPFVHEVHHRQKADSPSGTALHLSKLLLAGIDRKKEVLTAPPIGPIDRQALHVSSTRAGYEVGTHIVGFDSEADLIELRHVAKNRKGFAVGALTAARWLRGRKGVYTMDDVDL